MCDTSEHSRPSLVGRVTAGRVDIVVVYKIDRLTRSLTDFAKIVEILDARGASFVSVTQQFNTTTSMGRLTLNVLLSFAQFEREVIGERIRDKIAASKKKGMWMGGVPPLGYRVENHKLVIIDSEAEIVRSVFRRYVELGSVRLLKEELDAHRIKSKSWMGRSARPVRPSSPANGTRAGCACPRLMTTADSRARRWSGRRCNACSRMRPQQCRAGLRHDTGSEGCTGFLELSGQGLQTAPLRPARPAMGLLLQVVGKGSDQQIATETLRGPVRCNSRQATRRSCVDRSTNPAIWRSTSAMSVLRVRPFRSAP
jgi:hypothetical protein